MAIDFRIRPPYGEGRGLNIFAKEWMYLSNDLLSETDFGIGRRRIPSAINGDMDLFMREMDEAGIDVGVLMGRKTNDPKYGNISNKEIYELCDKYPGRFIPFAGINPDDADWRDQLKEGMDHGIKGIGLDPGWYANFCYCDAPKMMPIYEEAAKQGLIVSVTQSIYMGPDVTYSHPAAIQRVARTFPELKIVVPHACFPHIPEMLGVALVCHNIYLMPDCYFYTPHMPFANEIAEAANGWLKGRLLFASTYPVCGLKQAIEGWSKRPLSEDALLNSLHYNAARLLGIKL